MAGWEHIYRQTHIWINTSEVLMFNNHKYLGGPFANSLSCIVRNDFHFALTISKYRATAGQYKNVLN